MKKILAIGMIVSVLILAGCSEEGPLSPEASLDAYLSHWEKGDYEEMLELLEAESEGLIAAQEWDFGDRYEKVYGDLEIEITDLRYESVDFEGEETDLEALEEITYPVEVRMNSMAGEITYTTEVRLLKNLETVEAEEGEGDERENPWEVVWEPTHLLKDLQSPTDKIGIEQDQPQRGEIFDREGRGLAVNGVVYQASIVPEATEDLDGTVEAFAAVLGLSEERVDSLANQYPNRPDWAAPVQRISPEDPRIPELLEISGVLLSEIEGRRYGGGAYTGHVVGHVGPITAEELEEREGEGYASTALIGKNGLELAYEEELRGIAGIRIIVTDQDDENERVIAETEAKDGEDLQLTLDLEMQEKLSKSLEGEKGAGVLMDPKTGEVLALASIPAFDSNLRYLGLPDPRVGELEDVGVLFNRRFQNTYAPGSIFKPFTAIMGLEEGTLDPDEELQIEGLQWQESSQWGGYRVTRVSDRVTEVNLREGMVHSDNIYFARQALAIGSEAMESRGRRLGFGREVPFEFPLYQSSLSNEGLSSEPLLADTGYGQGQIQVSPVHMTAMYTIFLNQGDMLRPRLFLEGEREVFEPGIGSPEHIETVRNTLIEVMADESGSVYRQNPGHNHPLAGKSGTAELKADYTSESNELLGWFVSFDYEAEDLLLTVMIENTEGRGGSRVAIDRSHDFWSRME